MLSRERAGLALIVIIWTSLLLLAVAGAVPRYSARYEQNCSLCHVNPTGGGLRSTYATQYLIPEELSFSKPDDAVLETLSPMLTDNITVGVDFRLDYIVADERRYTLNFFQMQGDLYLNFQLGPRLALYLDRGMSQSLELFALAHVLPASGYVKAGRFTPAYGIKWADHTMFTRDVLGFFPPSQTDVGVEVGMFPGRFAIHASLLNGSRGTTFDTDSDVAAAGRAAYRFHLLGIGWMAGASGYYNPQPGVKHASAGGFGSLFWKKLTYIGEVDWTHDDPADAKTVDGLVASNEIALQILQGVDIKGTYDYYDPNIDYLTGAEQRFGGGFYALATPFVAAELLVRWYDRTRGIDMPEGNYLESLLQFHVLF